MATPSTPGILMPASGETGIRNVIQFLMSAFSGSPGYQESQWQIATDSGFTAIVVDTELREPDDWEIGEQWFDCHIGYHRLGQGTLHYARCRYRNTSEEVSAWSATVAFTTETKVTAAIWSEAA